MKGTLIVIISCILLLLFSACSSYIKQDKIDTSIKAQLTQEIYDMDMKDQKYRWQLLFGEPDLAIVDSLSKLPAREYVKHIRKKNSPENKMTESQYNVIQGMQDSLDQANRERILQIYKSYGWPGDQLVGKASGIVSIMILHFPDSLKLALFPKLKKEYKRGNISGATLARMYDKYLLETKKPLLYGMFNHLDTVSKQTLPPMVVDIKKTNVARKKLGLPPLEKYRLKNSEM